eukprot:scaffold125218_cov29-Tisochrysis_lutea.AAC.2
MSSVERRRAALGNSSRAGWRLARLVELARQIKRRDAAGRARTAHVGTVAQQCARALGRHDGEVMEWCGPVSCGSEPCEEPHVLVEHSHLGGRDRVAVPGWRGKGERTVCAAAAWSGVGSPSPLRWLAEAPASSRSCTTAVRPPSTAMCSAVTPRLAARSTLAPASRSARTTSVWPWSEASCKGVRPESAERSTVAPACSSAATVSLWPCAAAAWSEVEPPLVVASTPTPAASSSATTCV